MKEEKNKLLKETDLEMVAGGTGFEDEFKPLTYDDPLSPPQPQTINESPMYDEPLFEGTPSDELYESSAFVTFR